MFYHVSFGDKTNGCDTKCGSNDSRYQTDSRSEVEKEMRQLLYWPQRKISCYFDDVPQYLDEENYMTFSEKNMARRSLFKVMQKKLGIEYVDFSSSELWSDWFAYTSNNTDGYADKHMMLSFFTDFPEKKTPNKYKILYAICYDDYDFKNDEFGEGTCTFVRRLAGEIEPPKQYKDIIDYFSGGPNARDMIREVDNCLVIAHIRNGKYYDISFTCIPLDFIPIFCQMYDDDVRKNQYSNISSEATILFMKAVHQIHRKYGIQGLGKIMTKLVP